MSDASTPPSTVSRRSALAGLGAGGLGVALAKARSTSALEATPPANLAAGSGTATINGADLYYEVHGDDAGSPVLLLHGGLGNTEWWANLSPALVDAGYRVVVMDSRGHGRSTWGDAPITIEQLASDSLGLLDHIGIDATHLVGWSDGASIGLELAINHPARLDRAVLYGANFTPDGVHELTPTPQLLPFERIAADYQRLSPEPERFEELLGTLGALYETAPNYTEAQLRGITTPVLVLDGAEEEFIEPEHTVRLAELIPGAKLVIMPDTGHFAPFSQPTEFNRIVLDFLATGTVATPTS